MRLGQTAIFAALLAGIGTAQAADLPARVAPPPVVAVAAPGYNWTGFYIGANGGYGWAGGSATLAGVTVDGGDLQGPFAGGQIGFNYQTGQFVFGIEADGQWANINQSTTVLFPVLGALTFEDKINYFFTVRGRLGIAANNWLFYGTGGYAHIGWETSVTDGITTFSSSGNRGGWTAGGGTEVGFGNWSFKAEYLYIQTFDKDDVVFGQTLSTDIHVHTVKGALNYRFGGGPVVARY